MPVKATKFALRSFTFNSIKYDSSSGLPMSIEISDAATTTKFKPCDLVRPTQVAVTNLEASVTVNISDPSIVLTPGTKASLVAVLAVNLDDSSVSTLTMTDMVYTGDATRSQGQGSAHMIGLKFEYESATGATASNVVVT